MDTDVKFQTAREVQEYYDNEPREIGLRVPAPVLGRSVNDTRREYLRTIKQTRLPPDHPLYAVQCRRLQSDALNALEPQFLKAAVAETYNPDTVLPGELRAVPVHDERGQLSAVKFVGECFTRVLGRPGRRVDTFSNPTTGQVWDAKKWTWRR